MVTKNKITWAVIAHALIEKGISNTTKQYATFIRGAIKLLQEGV